MQAQRVCIYIYIIHTRVYAIYLRAHKHGVYICVYMPYMYVDVSTVSIYVYMLYVRVYAVYLRRRKHGMFSDGEKDSNNVNNIRNVRGK